MAAPVTSRSVRLAPASAGPSTAVLVELAGPGSARTSLGSAEEALRDARLTEPERAAIRALVRAVALLRARAGLAGIDDAGTAVHLVLRDHDADTRGPWASAGRISVGAKNALASRAPGRSRADVLLTVDTALHELTHVVQFARMGDGAHPVGAILEGIADSVAILADGDDTLGEGYYRVDAQGRPMGAVREVGDHSRVSGPTLGNVLHRYADAIAPHAEEHAAGGVVSSTMVAIRARLGRDRAEALLWAVIRDAAAWRDGGSWRELARALQRAAGTDAVTQAAVGAALAQTGLDAALR
ncbi:MAG: hypothetical protein JWM98_1493 [Thermoleophilia bacterium]|nr:hypothetical protein [Thermoleophilia bacterium]